tara:strand:- start:916 stop:1449 length:534 start_codon:yes stop_codon:yes gene_type:complete
MATKPRRRGGRKRRQDVKRQPSGQIRKSVYAERVKPTKEMQARRAKLLGDKNATGEIDCALDVIASPKHRLITPKQAEAGRRYAVARVRLLKTLGTSPYPTTPRLSEWIDNGQSVADGSDDGKAAFNWRKASMCIHDCGGDVRTVIDLVCLENQLPRKDQVTKLRIGLDALVRLWRI